MAAKKAAKDPSCGRSRLRAHSPSHIPVPLPPGHRFPMAKYARLAGRLKEEGWRIVPAEAASWQDVLRVHSPDYVRRLAAGGLTLKEERKLGLPQSPGLLERSLASVGGTIAALRDALLYGYGVNLAGGTHHAYPDHGEGFCVLNDHAVASRLALAEGLARQILIIDLDVHQGNGTAVVFAGQPEVFTCSVHGARNYPFHKEKSDLDIALPDGVGDDDYLGLLAATLPRLLDDLRPDLVLYQAGVDVLAGDRFGRLSLTLRGVEARDGYVYKLCVERNLPLVYTMGGGYHHDLGVTVQAHLNAVTVLGRVFA